MMTIHVSEETRRWITRLVIIVVANRTHPWTRVQADRAERHIMSTEPQDAP